MQHHLLTNRQGRGERSAPAQRGLAPCTALSGAGEGGPGRSVAAAARREAVAAVVRAAGRILDFSRRLTIVFKRPSCELVHQEWLTTARGHTVTSCDERGLACAAHTDVVYIHICGHVSAGSGHEFRIFPRPNNRCCSGDNGRPGKALSIVERRGDC